MITGLKMSDLKTVYDTINETKFLEELDNVDVLSLGRGYANVNWYIELVAVYCLYIYTHNKNITKKVLNIIYNYIFILYKHILRHTYGIRGSHTYKNKANDQIVITYLILNKMDDIYNQLTGSNILNK